LRRALLLPFRRDRKEDLVLHDGTAEPEAFLLLREGRVAEIGNVALELLASRGERAGAVKLVRAALRDRIHEEPGEIPLPHIERREEDLILLDRFDRNLFRIRETARLKRGAQAEQVVGHRAVDLDRVEPVVLTAAGQTGALR